MDKKYLYIFGGIFGFASLLVMLIFLFINSKPSNSSAANSAQVSTTTSLGSNSSSSSSNASSDTSSSSSSSSSFNNGSYTAGVSYRTHGHMESIQVALSIQNNIITSVSDTHSGNDPESVLYENAFESQVKDLVIGKKISDINLNRVAGASDTTDAFMNAINQIEQKAQG